MNSTQGYVACLLQVGSLAEVAIPRPWLYWLKGSSILLPFAAEIQDIVRQWGGNGNPLLPGAQCLAQRPDQHRLIRASMHLACSSRPASEMLAIQQEL